MSEENNNYTGCSPENCASCPGCDAAAAPAIPRTITLTLEDDTVVECAVLTIFPADDNEYIALMPLDDEGQSLQGEVYLYRYSQTENGEPVLSNIEEDAEYDKAAEVFDSLVENARLVAEAGPEDFE